MWIVRLGIIIIIVGISVAWINIWAGALLFLCGYTMCVYGGTGKPKS